VRASAPERGQRTLPFQARTPDDGTLFLTRIGVPFNESWLSTTVSQYVQKANIGKQGGCHLFRHTMATLMLENGADIRFIQAMLGHTDLKSTQIYTHVAVKQLKAIHDATHPAKARTAKPAAGAAGPPTADELLDGRSCASCARGTCTSLCCALEAENEGEE